MARVKYGTTFWGNKFLEAIENETDSGRLSRGKSYANTGKVYDIKLTSSKISAKVKGNYSPFYMTNLTFAEFKKGDKDFIIDFIDTNPLVLADIMNSRLSYELLSYLKNNEIDLFSGFDMSCDCYDYYGSYACKHISGLYFMLVNEIDKNPFILFSLRGLDLIKHYGIEKDLKISYPVEIEYSKSKEVVESGAFEMLQFGNQRDFILSLLESDPPFAPIDYKEVLEEFYRKTTKELPLVVFAIYDEKIDKIHRVLQEADISIEISQDISGAKFCITSSLFKNEEIALLFEEHKLDLKGDKLFMSPLKLFNLFISFEDSSGSAEYRYLFYLYRIAYILLQNSCFIPAVYESKESLQVFYKPLFSLEIVKKQIENLAKIAPQVVKFENKSLTQKSQTQLLLSAILTDFVPNLNFMHKKLKNNPPSISYAFFAGAKYKTDKFEDTNLASSLNNYFTIFDIIKSDYDYKIYIDKMDDYYEFKLKVSHKQSSEECVLSEAIQKFNKMQIIKFVSFLKEFLPSIGLLLQKNSIVLEKDLLEEFLLRTSKIISNLGVSIVLPKELQNFLKPKLSLSVKSSNTNHKSFFTLDGMLEYDWQLAIGDELISIKEFEELLKDGKELIEFKNSFVVITPEEAKAIFAQINKKTKLNKFDILQAKLNDEASFDMDLDNFFKELFTPKTVITPPSLTANLREYQQRGFEWSINNLLNGFGTILADDMGLGKTVQAITTILYLKENGFIKNSIVVVVPTSLLSNWEAELDRFAPSLSCRHLDNNLRHSKKRHREF